MADLIDAGKKKVRGQCIRECAYIRSQSFHRGHFSNYGMTTSLPVYGSHIQETPIYTRNFLAFDMNAGKARVLNYYLHLCK